MSESWLVFITVLVACGMVPRVITHWEEVEMIGQIIAEVSVGLWIGIAISIGIIGGGWLIGRIWRGVERLMEVILRRR